MQQTMLEGVAMWSVWQPDRNLFFNSFLMKTAEGNVAFDPLPLADDDAREIERSGGIAWIAITNRDHERDARAIAARFGAKIVASEGDAPLLSVSVDRTVSDGDALGGGIVIALDGLKTPGEFALHFRDLRAALVGDALWGSPAGALRLMPDDKLADPIHAARSLRRVAALPIDHLLVGDGACLFGNARKVVWETLTARSDAHVTKINRDEAPRRTWDNHASYEGFTYEIGDLIGAEKLGYRLTVIPPGKASAPLHWHTAEEELFVVMRGSATLITPHGRVALREGDYLNFPTRPDGAHKIVNESAADCEILMIANTDRNDVCSYPDSEKVLVEAMDLMVRSTPTLEYFDGE